MFSSFGSRSSGTVAYHIPSGFILDRDPARENSATHSGRVEIQKCPFALITPGKFPFKTSSIFSGMKGNLAR